eukprot:snap_masked-scaffold_33-processed-gene-3.16-mRNA-1 protein AED:1.00 eAED:1.00 QI:0/0/0/0/1/1/3/0/72
MRVYKIRISTGDSFNLTESKLKDDVSKDVKKIPSGALLPFFKGNGRTTCTMLKTETNTKSQRVKKIKGGGGR